MFQKGVLPPRPGHHHDAQPHHPNTTTPGFFYTGAASALTERKSIKDPYVWRKNGHFDANFKDTTGKTCGKYDGGIHALFENSITWRLADAPLACSRELLRDDERLLIREQFERPQLFTQNELPT